MSTGKSLQIKSCPTCGSRRIRLVRKDVKGMWLGKHPYVAPNVEFYECPVCGERLYDRAAMQQIQSHRPKIRRVVDHRKAS